MTLEVKPQETLEELMQQIHDKGGAKQNLTMSG